jgi:hypothetical protein
MVDSGLFAGHITPSICYEMLNISYFDKFLLILFVGFKISFYFCISKNDKSLKRNDKSHEEEIECILCLDAGIDGIASNHERGIEFQ